MCRFAIASVFVSVSVCACVRVNGVSQQAINVFHCHVTNVLCTIFPPAVLVVSLMLCAVSHAAFTSKSAYNFRTASIL